MTPSRLQLEPPASLGTDGDFLPDDEPLNFPVLRLMYESTASTYEKSNCVWVFYLFQTFYWISTTNLELLLIRSSECYIPLSHLLRPTRVETSGAILLVMAANQTSWAKVIWRRDHIRIVHLRRTDNYSTKTNKQCSRTNQGTTSR